MVNICDIMYEGRSKTGNLVWQMGGGGKNLQICVQSLLDNPMGGKYYLSNENLKKKQKNWRGMKYVKQHNYFHSKTLFRQSNITW